MFHQLRQHDSGKIAVAAEARAGIHFSCRERCAVSPFLAHEIVEMVAQLGYVAVNVPRCDARPQKPFAQCVKARFEHVSSP